MASDAIPIDVQSLRDAKGTGVRFLVLDSGIETSHPDLTGTTIRSFRVDLDEQDDADVCRIVKDADGDVYGHGTAVASIIHRFAPDAIIDSVKVIGRPLGSSRFVAAAL